MWQPSEEERMILSMVDGVCEDVISQRAAEIDADDEYPDDMHRLIAEQGLLALAFEEEQGGFGLGIHLFMRCVERIARESPAVALTMVVALAGADPIARFAPASLQGTILPGLIAGTSKISFALTEPNAGSNPSSMAASAMVVDGGYRINASKLFISNASVADRFIVFANVEDGPSASPACFIVERGAEGVKVGEREAKIGLHGSPTCPVFLENVDVPSSSLIGEVGQGLEIAYHALDRARIGLAAIAIGTSRFCLDAASAYAKERKQFGQRIAEFQEVRALIANGWIDIEAAEALLDRACDACDVGDPSLRVRAAAAKLFSSELAVRLSGDAVQIHGAYGVCREYGVERAYRDARILTLIGGSSQIQRGIVGKAALAGSV